MQRKSENTPLLSYIKETDPRGQDDPDFIALIKTFSLRPFDGKAEILEKMNSEDRELFNQVWQKDLEAQAKLLQKLKVSVPIDDKKLRKILRNMKPAAMIIIDRIKNELWEKIKTQEQSQLSVTEIEQMKNKEKKKYKKAKNQLIKEKKKLDQAKLDQAIEDIASGYLFHIFTDASKKRLQKLKDAKHQDREAYKKFAKDNEVLRLISQAILSDEPYEEFLKVLAENVEKKAIAETTVGGITSYQYRLEAIDHYYKMFPENIIPIFKKMVTVENAADWFNDYKVELSLDVKPNPVLLRALCEVVYKSGDLQAQTKLIAEARSVDEFRTSKGVESNLEKTIKEMLDKEYQSDQKAKLREEKERERKEKQAKRRSMKFEGEITEIYSKGEKEKVIEIDEVVQDTQEKHPKGIERREAFFMSRKDKDVIKKEEGEKQLTKKERRKSVGFKPLSGDQINLGPGTFFDDQRKRHQSSEGSRSGQAQATKPVERKKTVSKGPVNG